VKVLFSSKSVDVCTSRLVHHFFRVLKVFTINIRWWLKHSKTYIWRSTGLLGWRRIKWHRALSLWWWMLRHMVLYPQRQHQNRLLGGPFWCRVMFLGSVIFWLLSSACVSQCPVLYYTARLHGSCAPPPWASVLLLMSAFSFHQSKCHAARFQELQWYRRYKNWSVFFSVS